MTNGTVGVAQAATPDRLIDNDSLTVGAQTVYRQRVNPVPVARSTYFSGTSGSVNVPTTHLIVSVSCHCTTAGTVSIGGGSDITVPDNCSFSEVMADAPIAGTGAGSVVFTGTDTYFVRVVPAVT